MDAGVGTAQCPVTLPGSAEADPYPAYARLRDVGEVYVIQEPTGLRRWTFVGYAGARRAFADPRLSKDPRRAWDELLRTGYVTGDPEGDQYLFHLLNTDPPDHTRLRRIVLEAFTPARVAALRPRMEQIVERLLDGMDPYGPTDLHRGFALPLAVTVMGELIGVPTGDFDAYHRWATAGLMVPGAPDAPLSRAEAYVRMKQSLTSLVEVRRRELEGAGPGTQAPDLLGVLIAARDEGRRLSEQELVALTMFLLNTGQDTTVNMIANGMHALLIHPDQLGMLREQPELMLRAIEELLRFEGPVSLSTLRIATQDIAVDGVLIPQGAVVSIAMSSANHDPRQFTDPDRLDITRCPNAHLAFGHGIHRCLGAPLARVMAEVAFGTLLRRFPDVQLGCSVGELRWRSARVMRGLLELPVILAPRGPAGMPAAQPSS